ncbi:MAG: diaminopimelate epimerase [Candidatus Thiodiazotropha sp.]|jgi:diaminopimelate epimerase
MIIKFTKMHGLGNDFVVLDAVTQNINLSEIQRRHIAHRRFGIGCDQILLIQPPQDHHTDFHFQIFNADGSEAGACGNGARCFAQFVRMHNMSDKEVLRVSTSSGTLVLHHIDTNLIEVDMGKPQFSPAQIPFIADQQAKQYSLDVGGEQHTISTVSMGNPHAVLLVSDVELAPVDHLGPLIEHHGRFPERTNVGFLQIENSKEVKLRVFERGAGETQACGSGACAAVVAGRQLGLLDDEVIVHLRGGDLVVKWPSLDQSVLMRGPAQTVFEGTIEL